MFLELKTKKKVEAIDITTIVNDAVKTLYKKYHKDSNEDNNVDSGLVFLFNPHTTSALLINEGADPNLMDDLLKKLSDLIPEHDGYKHDLIDNNASSHIRTSLFQQHLLIPFNKSGLLLGTWQSIFYLEFDGPRTRKLFITIIPTL